MIPGWIHRLVPGLTEHPKDQKVRAKAASIGALVGIGVNLTLAASKMLAGAMIHSVAVIADGANNLSDAGGSLMALVATLLAQKPLDREHPYGHGRLEYIGALGVGVIILVMAFELLLSSARSIFHPEPLQSAWWMLFILVLSIAAKAWLWRFYDGLGKQIDSAALIATSKDALSDVMATSAVLLCTLAAPFTSLPLDGIMGLIVAALVFRAGYGVCKDMLDSLMGGKPDPELGRQVIELLEAHDGILGTHDLMIHDYGPGRCVASVHAEVSADMSILDAHELIDLAELEIGRKLNIPICIHMDPIVTGDPDTDRAKAALVACLQAMSHDYHLHDLRRVPGERRINLVFDVAVPADLRDTSAITSALQACATKLDPRHCCVIHYDIDYYHP